MDLNLTSENCKNYFYFFTGPIFRAVEKEAKPLYLSRRQHRAACADTAGLSGALDSATAIEEFRHHSPNKDYDLWRITPPPIKIFNISDYCKDNSLPIDEYYSSEQNSSHKIHLLFGQSCQAVMWTSIRRPEGKSLELYIENIPNFMEKVKTEIIAGGSA